MRFIDFLRTSVLLFAGAANVLALLTILGADTTDDRLLLYVSFAWWLVAAGVGGWLGRREETFAGVARLMASARAATALPDFEPGAVLFNRLWSLGAFTFAAGGVGFLLPQVTAIAVGFPIMVALALRKQASAVQAVEERDGVQFHVDRTSPLKPTRLVRTPGLKKWVGEPRNTSYEREPA